MLGSLENLPCMERLKSLNPIYLNEQKFKKWLDHGLENHLHGQKTSDHRGLFNLVDDKGILSLNG